MKKKNDDLWWWRGIHVLMLFFLSWLIVILAVAWRAGATAWIPEKKIISHYLSIIDLQIDLSLGEEGQWNYLRTRSRDVERELFLSRKRSRLRERDRRLGDHPPRLGGGPLPPPPRRLPPPKPLFRLLPVDISTFTRAPHKRLENQERQQKSMHIFFTLLKDSEF